MHRCFNRGRCQKVTEVTAFIPPRMGGTSLWLSDEVPKQKGGLDEMRGTRYLKTNL